MSAIESAMARMISPRLIRRLNFCPVLTAVLLSAVFCFAESPYEKSGLVRVNVTTEFQGAAELLELKGRLLDEYNPNVIQKFSSAGVVFDSAGHIMTFLGYGRIFVKKNESRFEITVGEGTRYKGELLGIDHGNGAAVIQVEDGKLKETSICADCDIREGTTVIAPVFTGSGGTQFQSTQIISINRNGMVQDRSGLLVRMNRPFLDLGQPIFADDYRVLGFIVSQDLSNVQNEVYPVSELLSSARTILEKGGDIREGWLGVFPENVHTSSGPAVMIRRVEKDSPAQKAGIVASDILAEYNGRKIENVFELIDLVQDTPVGSDAELTIVRRGRPMALKASIEPRRYQNPLQPMTLDLKDPFMPKSAPLDPEHPVPVQGPRIGFETVALTPDLADFMKVRFTEGLVVVNSLKGSPGDLAGIKNGDVILAVNGEPVTDIQKTMSSLGSLRAGSSVSIKVLRKDTERTITVQVPE
jgi:S1-C subfamily serine protease